MRERESVCEREREIERMRWRAAVKMLHKLRRARTSASPHPGSASAAPMSTERRHTFGPEVSAGRTRSHTSELHTQATE